jgi:glutamine amidotransferase
LRSLGLDASLREALTQKPVLAVCIGEQMLFERSEEANAPGLGIFKGDVLRLRPGLAANGLPFKVPHMGWNTVRQTGRHRLWQDIPNDAYFYFVHSYHVQPADPVLQVGETDYGGFFTSAVAQDNIFAVQFHPEKSAAAGLQLYKNFLHWNP